MKSVRTQNFHCVEYVQNFVSVYSKWQCVQIQPEDETAFFQNETRNIHTMTVRRCKRYNLYFS